MKDPIVRAEKRTEESTPRRHRRPPTHQRKGWRKPEGAVLVTRPYRWGNPYTVAEYGRQEAIRRYEADLVAGTLVTGPGRAPLGLADVAELAGKDVVCACPLDEPCHGDVLLKYARGAA